MARHVPVSLDALALAASEDGLSRDHSRAGLETAGSTALGDYGRHFLSYVEMVMLDGLKERMAGPSDDRY